MNRKGLHQLPLTFVAHLPLQPSGGGIYAVNWQVHRQLQRHFALTPFQSVVPPQDRWQAVYSKFRRRILRRPGSFFQFSQRALDRTAEVVARQIPIDTRAVFFRSSTRWIHCQPPVPYFVHLDAVFHTFFHNTFREIDFHRNDLKRIYESERRFLENASGVFFESEWGLKNACSAYGFSGANAVALGIGGAFDPAQRDVWDGKTLRLVTIAKHFRQKGGDLVLDAYRLLKPDFPALSWHIIGGPPEGDWQSCPDIYYDGFLNLQVAEQEERLRTLFGGAFLFIHPTREDVNPLVLIEAAGFGCPSVSVRDFAIPELVVHNETGLLLDRPVTGEALAAAIRELVEDRPRYLTMRKQARERAVHRFDWNAIGDEMAGHIHRSLAQANR